MLSNSQVYLYSSNKPPMYENYHHHPALVCSSSISTSQSTTTSCAASASSSTSSIINSNRGTSTSSTSSASNIKPADPLIQRHQFQLRKSSLQTNPQNSSSNSGNSSNSSASNPVQIQNYITWINSHLKKRPGLSLVDNLQTDLCSGVTLTYLIEIISASTPGADLTLLRHVNMSPKSMIEYRDNVEIILRFMQTNSIKMHQTTAKEICEGNLKAIMRLVLALAAHFKPTNVQPYSAIQKSNSGKTITQSVSVSNTNSQQGITSKRSSSTNNINYANNPVLPSYTAPPQNVDRHVDTMTHLVQAACVNLADVRRFKNENFNVKYVKRNKLMETPPVDETYLLDKAKKNSAMSPSIFSASSSSSTVLVSNSAANNMSPSTFLVSSNSPGESNPIASSTVLIPNSRVHLYENMDEVEQEAPKRATSRNLTYTLSTLEKENEVKPVLEVEEKPSEEEAKAKKEQVSSVEIKPIMRSEAIQNDLGDIETLNDVLALKNILIDLQAMFMNESNEEDNGENTVVPESTRPVGLKRSQSSIASSHRHMSVSTPSGLSKDEQIAILKSRIQQLEILVDDLRGELSDAKSNLMAHSGLNSGLKSRITEQNQTILQMKNEEIKLNMDYAKMNKEKDEMSDDMTRYLEQIEELKRVVELKNKEIATLKAGEHDANHDEETSVLMAKLRSTLSSVESVQLLDKLEKAISTRPVTGSVKSRSANTSASIPSSNSISTSVSSLISSTSGSSSSVASSSANSPVLVTNSNSKQPTQQSVENNESNVKKIISRLLSQNQQEQHSTLPPTPTVASNTAQSKIHKLGNLVNNFESSSMPPPSSHPKSNNNLLTISSSVMSNSSNSEHTKCIYYTDNRATPYMITIAKPIGSVTLADLKQSLKLKSSGSGYVFRFKTVDPEFGVLKEEVTHDYKPLPTFENKIVAWIESSNVASSP